MATTASARRSRSSRGADWMESVREQATTSRLVAGAALAVGAAVYALMRDPARRDSLKQKAQGYLDRGKEWWNAEPAVTEPSPVQLPPA